MELQLKNCKIVNQLNFFELPEKQQLQFLLACKNAFGKKMSPLEYFKAGEISEQMHWEHFDAVNSADLKLYDVWVLAGDSGTVFFGESTESTGVEMCQSYWDPVMSDDRTAEICKEIDSAYENCQKSFEIDNEFSAEACTEYWDDFYAKIDAAETDADRWHQLGESLYSRLL